MEGIGPGELVRRFLSGRSPATARAYAADLEDLARFLGTSIEDAVRSLLLGPESARRRLLEYAVDLRRRGLAPATRRRRLATLRALLGMAREQGMITWAVE
ncbi:MAG TPA: site-specific integrase, partial [Candidatus Dormibacteraeota bacterium]|nr:site-specific integrase [Candidatus Dormibacteraeota bacterium]